MITKDIALLLAEHPYSTIGNSDFKSIEEVIDCANNSNSNRFASYEVVVWYCLHAVNEDYYLAGKADIKQALYTTLEYMIEEGLVLDNNSARLYYEDCLDDAIDELDGLL